MVYSTLSTKAFVKRRDDGIVLLNELDYLYRTTKSKI